MSTYLGMAQRTQCGGLEVSMLTFYYDELSSNPILSGAKSLEAITKINEKEAGDSP